MTEHERRSRQSEQTQPDGLAARAREATPTEETEAESAGEADSGRKPFNPWVRGVHKISEAHRRELLAMELPKTPAERLFQLGQATDAKASAPPAVTVDSPTELGGSGLDESRRADTLRLRRVVPLAHPFRRAALVAAAASIVVASILWLALGGDPPPPSSAVTTPTQNAATPGPVVASAESSATMATPTSKTPTEEPPVSPSVEPTAPKKSKTRQKAEETGRPASPVGSSCSSPKVMAAPPNTPPKPSPTASDDDASPYGKWAAPPRP